MICLESIARYGATALFAAACLSSTTTSAFADSYDVYTIGRSAGTVTARGIDSSGQALLSDVLIEKYQVYNHGALVSSTDTVPASFIPDNGTSCTVAYHGVTYQGVCNNGYQAFGQHYIDNPLEAGLYVGHDGVFTGLDLGGIPGNIVATPFIYLNSSGDVVFLDEGQDTNYQAYNTTTPEPSSYLLLLTGVGVAFAAHRRLLS